MRLAALPFAVAVLALGVVAVRGVVEQASAQAPPGSGDQIFVPPESAGPLVEPPVIASRNGVLKAQDTVIRAGIPGSGRSVLWGGLPTYSSPLTPPDSPLAAPPGPPAAPPHFPLNFAAGFQFAAYGKSYPAQFPAPTLRLNIGDTLDLTTVNRLQIGKSNFKLPAGALEMNLHTHGLETSPLDDGDNIFRSMNPGTTSESRIKVLGTNGDGIDWYHTHKHGYVSDQVYGGLAGMLQIGDPLDPWPQYRGKYQERLLGLSTGIVLTDDQGRRYIEDPTPSPNVSGKPPNPYGGTWQKYVNGQYNPTITIRPGETQIWTFASIGRNVNYNLGITDRNGQNPWAATVLSYEGFGKDLSPRPITTGLPVPYAYNGPTVLDPGARITMAVTAPKTPGTYYLVDDMLMQLQPDPQGFFALATIQVTGAPATVPRPNLTPTGPAPQIYRAKPDHYRTFTWANVTSGKTIAFSINGGFFPMNPIVTLQAGQVEQWLLVNTSPIDHTFHIHQNHFAVIASNSGRGTYTNPYQQPAPGTYRYASLRDTINIPPDGSVLIRFRVSAQLGKYVFHCHILPHEDAGMMMAVLAIPSPFDRRVALGSQPGQPNAVFVKNGNGGSVGRINVGPPGARGGVATATGELTNDLTEDTVVGIPGSGGSPASVSVYDGKTGRRIARFRPFRDFPRAGVSLATGNINGEIADIIVGRVGPGPSLVRIFSPNGALLRTIKGTIPGPLPNGVTVASADLNGDNFDDVAIGAGRGASRPLTPLAPPSGLAAQDAAARVLPRVVVLDGSTLLNRSQRPHKLFSFVAAGGAGSGVNLAAGYYDPKTRPGILANLITTPQTGRLAGTVQVWSPPFEAPHLTPALIGDPTVPGASRAEAAQAAKAGRASNSRAWSQSSALLLYCVHHFSGQSSSGFKALASRVGLPATASTSPRVLTTLHPLGRHLSTGLNLAVTFLGKAGLDALAAWTDPRNPVYTSIDSQGAVSTVRTPTR
jgi:FtsP/CotA-like multicopper oxidase with cupredoxin domain